jgi:tRNA(fMet)-specific endonuclease VapC
MASLRATAGALHTSAVCVMELRFGAVRHPSGGALWRRIEREVLAQVQVLALGFDEASRAGELLADLECGGQRIGVEDVLIAATALVHGLVVVTRNVRHFARIPGLSVEDWWQ